MCARGAARGRAGPPRHRRKGAPDRGRALLLGPDRRAPGRDLRARRRPQAGRGGRLMKTPLPGSRWLRLGFVLASAAAAGALLWWRGPDWDAVLHAFDFVQWQWVVAAIGLNLASILLRALAWQTVISQAMPPPRPRFPLVFSAFCVGLFANAVLPGRIGELARVAVLTRKTSPRTGTWATLVGTVFAHRVFDLIPAVLLIVYVLVTAKIPDWAITSLIAVVAVGSALFMLALASARRHHRSVLEEAGTLKRVVEMARQG